MRMRRWWWRKWWDDGRWLGVSSSSTHCLDCQCRKSFCGKEKEGEGGVKEENVRPKNNNVGVRANEIEAVSENERERKGGGRDVDRD